MQRRLGRGLGSLLGEPASAEPRSEIELARIRPNPHQPRRVFRQEALEELRSSIATHGVLQPVVVRAVEEGFELIAGERRLRAAKMAGLERIPAVVREVSDEELLELALVENVQRQDLDPIEKALGYRDLMQRLELTQEAVAGRVGLQRSTIANHLRLLELPTPAQDAVSQGMISMGHARALLGLPDAASQLTLLEETVRQQLSVREVEQRVRERVRPRPSRPSAPASEAAVGSHEPPRPAWAADLERRLREALGTKVTLATDAACKGRLSIEFFDRPALERLIELLAPSKQL